MLWVTVQIHTIAGTNMKNIKIVDAFLYLNYRSPTEDEFVLLGGDLEEVKENFSNYRNFLTANGYDIPSKAKIVEVYDLRGNLLFTGSTSDAAEHFNVKPKIVARSARLGLKLNWKYNVKYKKTIFNIKEAIL